MKMAAALLWPSSEEKYFLYCKQASPAGLACLLFHGKGRNGRRHLLALAPLLAPAPLRGAAAAAAEGPSNRRSAKNAFSEAASIFPLRLLPWGLKGACSPFLVAGWVESRGREGGVETPLPASGPAERPGALSKRHSLSPRKALYTTKKAPKRFRFEAFELELLSRFELETSSLPRMRSTN